MKRTVRVVALTLVAAMMLLLTGCFAYQPQKQLPILKTYPKDSAPSQVVKTQDRWVMLNSVYGGQDYTISVGEDLETAAEIYSVTDVTIRYFEANDHAVVWCEKTDEFYTYKAYLFETQSTQTVFQTAAEPGFQTQDVGVFQKNIYYCNVDYENRQVRVVAYDMDSQNTEDIYCVPFSEDQQPYSIIVEREYLSFVCSDQVEVLDLEKNEVVFASALPGDVEHVFGVSYDSIKDTCALYYADGDSEDIGFMKEGDTSICSVFTFAANHYAYYDKVRCYDGRIYWISQANVSGNVTDHYKLIDYDYLNHKPVETERTFAICRGEDGFYVLRFNKDGKYTHIDLCRY